VIAATEVLKADGRIPNGGGTLGNAASASAGDCRSWLPCLICADRAVRGIYTAVSAWGKD